jgi:hypothetical protein
MRYQNIDGTWEIGVGFLFLTMTFLEKSLRGAPPNTVWHWRGTVLLSLALLGFVVLGGVRALKERFTYRRTGLVKYRGLAGKPWLIVLISAAIGVPLALLSNLLMRHSKLPIPVAVGSAMWGLFYAFATRLEEAWRWVVLVIMVGGPVAISTLPLDREWLETLSAGFLGLTLLVSGGIAFYLYLRRTPPPEREAE